MVNYTGPEMNWGTFYKAVESDGWSHFGNMLTRVDWIDAIGYSLVMYEEPSQMPYPEYIATRTAPHGFSNPAMCTRYLLHGYRAIGGAVRFGQNYIMPSRTFRIVEFQGTPVAFDEGPGTRAPKFGFRVVDLVVREVPPDEWERA